MTQFLPANLLALFAPRDPIPYLPPACKLPHEKKTAGYIGLGAFLQHFEDPKDTPPPVRVETREERLERRRRERNEQVAYKLEQEIAVWDPAGIPNVTADPFKTLFVARINYDTSESKLRREFEVYGPIKKIVMIHNTVNGKPRGYAFIEYEHERDMHSAYKHADGKKIDGRRVLVDVERARTVKGWLPRRLGGGLGGTRRGGPDVNIKHSGREDNERERERYRLEREREAVRDRDRDRDRADRDRRRSRERERPKRRSRSRSRERNNERNNERNKRRRSRERVEPEVEELERPPRDRRERERDRGAERDRKRRRSRSNDRERERSRRDKRERDRDRADRTDRRDRKDRPDRIDRNDEDVKDIRIKEEPIDDYPEYNQEMYFAQVKYEQDPDEPEEKYRIPENQNDRPYNYNSVPDY
ncbi:U1 small nuclear ribonucleoprotein 70 kDa [Phymastichus coffea]|uniref:U1 small nuclear ribonucleoprotein 70 kDa n=1 Tax=Phymastichus coffea TaxID=108790 RepID=UPI00273B6621|nr:U1 small nuclear ribonucleoprotein 70 kDa [Phymastichus coffea]